MFFTSKKCNIGLLLISIPILSTLQQVEADAGDWIKLNKFLSGISYKIVGTTDKLLNKDIPAEIRAIELISVAGFKYSLNVS